MDIVERLWIDRDAKDPLLYGERKEAAKEIERLREALKKSQDDMKWWITQTEMRGITFARVTLEGGGG